MADRIWDGRAVHFAQRGLGGLFDNKPLRLDLKEEAARKLALLISKYKQICNDEIEAESEEILQALNYVLVGDPVSHAAHRRMEAGKGMTPDGG